MKSNISKPKNQPQKLNKNNNVSVANKTNFSTRRKNKSIKVDRYDGNSFVLKKQEFVQNIVPFSGPKFSATKFEVNPGIKTTFPWLSSIAMSFQKYVIKHITFEYKTAQSTFAPGMVMLAPSFDVRNEVPKTKSEMLEYAKAVRSPVWKDFSLRLDERQVMSYKTYYMRNGGKTEDLHLYDPFFLLVATDAVSDELEYIGELWVSYEIHFIDPIRLDSTVDEFEDYVYFTGQNTLQNAIFQNCTKFNGGLDVVVTTPTSLTFKQTFTGFILLLVDFTNHGNSPTAGITQSIVSDNGKVATGIQMTGSGPNDSGSFLFVQILLQDIEVDDVYNLTNINLEDVDQASVLVSTAFYIVEADLPNPLSDEESEELGDLEFLNFLKKKFKK